ncbi:uncharacterized protein LOC131804477 [Musca domestica]|uniref:Uncharacterized protein LOC131804477 n=1 Tax=Musca domestica TaxID=7370 RepID=A0ABM3VC84_MUSDO|nr:uncharacterized protein LOC131804477 [Musca domestica]
MDVLHQSKTFIYLLLLYGVSLAQALTIREEAAETTTHAATPPPPQSFPSIHRVRNAFVYEDADDVIHVIEPPKHFEQLKILMQSRQNGQAIIGREIKPAKREPPPPPTKTPPGKARPGRPQINVGPKKPLKHLWGTKKPFDMDLEIQETENLPIEILASVRKTENYLKKYKPKIPSAPRQRVKTKKIQTVIWEKSQEQQQYVQGQEQKVNGIREYYQPQEKNNINRRKFIKKRIKRQTGSTDYETLKGDELLDRINELVKNASIYLDNFNVYEDIDVGTATTEETGSTTLLHKETLGRTTGRPFRKPLPQLHEDAVIEILENSVKATNVIMEQIKNYTNSTNLQQNCDDSRSSAQSAHTHIHNLRQQIQCMQSIIEAVNTTTFQKSQHYPSSTQRPQSLTTTTAAKRFGERLTERKSKDLRHKPFLVATVEDEYFADSSPSPLNTSLIYDDVMTTIRNLLQTTNLQTLEESTLPSSPPTSSDDTEISPEILQIPQDNSEQPVDFHNLNQYLNSLQTIVANLPQSTNSTLNLHEIENKPSKYYFINPVGGIYNLPQPFHPKDRRPPSAIFRQFPDIPSIREYLGASGSLLKATQNVIEIL